MSLAEATLPPPRSRGLRLRPEGVAFLAGPGPALELGYSAGAVVLVVGVPGAGKTMLIERLFTGDTADVLDTEAIRARWQARLGTARGYRLYRPLVHLEHHLRVRRALGGAGALVVHETGTKGWLRRRIARRAAGRGRSLHLLALDVPRPVAEAGQRARGRRVRARSMDRHERGFAVLRRALRCEPAVVPMGAEGFASALVLDRLAGDRVRAVRFGA
jgi:hypothetical protein